MVKYDPYTTEKGVRRVFAYSDAGFKIERDGVMYDTADDFEEQHRTYTETDIPVDTIPADRMDRLEQAIAELRIDEEADAGAIIDIAEIIGG